MIPSNPAPFRPLRSLFAGDPEMRELVSEFAAELPERAGQIARHAEGRDAAAVMRLAHQLRGAAGAYGFPTIGESAGRIEDALRGLDNPGRTRALEGLRTQIEELAGLCDSARAGAPISHSRSPGR
ncbi:MAG: Hpt domain-containing protein [Phycisphaeraceae bacterium]|nr:MAG: Hpt domain-containing protein [Phycisphaeraceae bacterium]